MKVYFREINVFVALDVKIRMRSYDVTTHAPISRRTRTLPALRSFAKTNATMLKAND